MYKYVNCAQYVNMCHGCIAMCQKDFMNLTNKQTKKKKKKKKKNTTAVKFLELLRKISSENLTAGFFYIEEHMDKFVIILCLSHMRKYIL